MYTHMHTNTHTHTHTSTECSCWCSVWSVVGSPTSMYPNSVWSLWVLPAVLGLWETPCGDLPQPQNCSSQTKVRQPLFLLVEKEDIYQTLPRSLSRWFCDCLKFLPNLSRVTLFPSSSPPSPPSPLPPPRLPVIFVTFITLVYARMPWAGGGLVLLNHFP